MGTLYHLGQKFIDFCKSVNQIEDNVLSVPTSHVVYELDRKAYKTYGTLQGCNLDTITNAGSYGINGSNTYTNLPSGVLYGVLTVFRASNSENFITQMITMTAGSRVYQRNSANGGSTWGVWDELMRFGSMSLKTFSVDATTSQGGIYCGEKALTATDIENARVVIAQYARKTGYAFPCTCAYENGALRVQSPISLTDITVGVVLIK